MFSSNASTEQFLIEGIVPEEVSIKINPRPRATNLNLSAAPVGLRIATVVEKSNSSTGYSISAKSLNGSLLKNGNLDELRYLISYDNGPKTTLTTSETEMKRVNAGNVIKYKSPVTITYTGKPASEMVQGTYSDTIIFTISSN
jgi:hypothetical protein